MGPPIGVWVWPMFHILEGEVWKGLTLGVLSVPISYMGTFVWWAFSIGGLAPVKCVPLYNLLGQS